MSGAEAVLGYGRRPARLGLRLLVALQVRLVALDMLQEHVGQSANDRERNALLLWKHLSGGAPSQRRAFD
jgi:hypothetical protein